METASENGDSAVTSSGMIALYAIIGSLAVLLCVVAAVSCIRKEIRRRKRETVNMDSLEVPARYGSSLNRQRSISLIDINAHPEISKVHRRESVDSIPRLLSLSCEIPRQPIGDLDVEARQYRASTSIQRYMKSKGLVKDQIDVWDETDEEVEEAPKKGLKYKKSRPRSRSTDSHSKSILVQSISLSDSEGENKNNKGKAKIRDSASDTDDRSIASKVSKSSKISKVSRTSKKSATTRHQVESDSEEEYSTDSDHKRKKTKHNNNDNNSNTTSQPSKKKKHKKVRKPSSRNLLQTSASSGSTTDV